MYQAQGHSNVSVFGIFINHGSQTRVLVTVSFRNMKWKRCSPSRVAGSPLLTSKISSSLFVPDWSSWISLRRMYSGLLYVSHFQASKFIKLLKLFEVFNTFVPDCAPSVRTRCIHHETSTFCLCLGGACCVNSG